MRLALLAAALLLTLAAAADAATVTVRPAGQYDEVHYGAAPGETNRVLVAYAGDARSVTITDSGAPITAMAPCVAVDAHTARCTKRPEATVEWLQSTRVELGDGADEVHTTRPGPASIGGVIALGGPGDDLLDGGAGSDTLDGGGGTDVLLGGEENDALTDGDADTTANADVLDGGAGADTVSYARRSAPVRVTLGDALPDGAPGEGDTVRGVEGATGGTGNDRLIGDAGANRLLGGAGDDTLVGDPAAGTPAAAAGRNTTARTAADPRATTARASAAAGDTLRGGAGDDTVRGGAGDDDLRGDRGTDLITCGRGIDLVHEPKRGERLERACEAIRYAFDVAREDSLLFSPHPYATSPATARFSIGCPERERLDGEPSRCTGTLTLREASSARRLIGRGILAGRFGRDAPPVRVALTALGRRLAQRHAGVDVTATIAGRGLQTRSWTFPLRVR
jgi:RTX calcium-binding nonapeptide repeat (4 copies)